MQANLIPAKLNAVRDRLLAGAAVDFFGLRGFGPRGFRPLRPLRPGRFGGCGQDWPRKLLLAVCMAALCAVAAGLGGCEHHVVHAAVSKMVPPTPVMNEAGPPPEIHPEDSNAEMLAFLTPSEPIAPAEPVHTAPSVHHTETTPRPTAPQISQQISPADEAVYKQRTESAIAIAEKNLRQAAGKQLNSSQRDMVEKIRAFVSQSREALAGSDWTRAQNLAQKAEVLSTELANSL